jgi:FdhD protein
MATTEDEATGRSRFRVTDEARETGVLRMGVMIGGEEGLRSAEDDVAHEEPLEIQVMGASMAVLMRTPGHDEELALGFLLTEGLIDRAADVASIRHCTSVKDPEAEENIVRVVLAPGARVPIDRARTGFASSSCGLCGKATIESTLVRCDRLAPGPTFLRETLFAMPDRMRAAQSAFTRTGGVHAAAVFAGDGELVLVREDVGRHNAVDKVVGALARTDRDPRELALVVSGRISFEIAQKAAVARLPIVAGVSAPTSLAVRFAERAGLTVVGFLRGRSMNVYTRPSRIDGALAR